MRLPPKKKGVSDQLLKLIAYDSLAGLKPHKFKKRNKGGRVRDPRGRFASGGSVDDSPDEATLSAFPETYADPRSQKVFNGIVDQAASLPQRAFEASENMRQGGDYDPAPILEAATLPMGTGALAGLPLRAGEMALGAGPIRAYHGSPHDFDAFNLSKIGTGEGNQAYGHGLYFAENEKVAKSYRDTLSALDVDFENPQQAAASFLARNGGDPVKAESAMRSMAEEMNTPSYAKGLSDGADLLKSGADLSGVKPPGHMYEVSINADPEHFLDWDKPLSEQHPEALKKLKESGSLSELESINAVNDPRTNVRELLNSLKRGYRDDAPVRSHDEVTQQLSSSGIPGIKYFDQVSRGAGEGSRNYVVFNDKLIDILKKYGIVGAAATTMADEIMNQGKQHFAAGGRVGYADGGAPQFAPDATPEPLDTPKFAPDAKAEPLHGPEVGGLTSALRGAEQGATFGFADELAGLNAAGPKAAGMLPIVGGIAQPAIGAARMAKEYLTVGDQTATTQYEKARDEARAADELAKQQHPYLHMAGELAGSIPAMAVLPGGEIAQGAGLASKMVKGAQVGAEYGGLSGLGEGTDTGDRAMKAATGIVGGIVGGAAAPVVGALGSQVTDRVVSPAVGAVRGALNPEGEASRRLAAALQKDQELIASGQAEGMSPQDWIKAKSSGEPVTLADLGSSNTQALLRSSANTSPEGRAILEKVINDRFAGQSERVGDTVRGLVAGGANAGKTAEQLVADYDKARAPLYKQAFQQGDKEIVSPTIERLMGSPMFESAMKFAVTTGKDRAVTEGYGAFNPGVTVENGMIKFTKTNPNGVPQYPNLQYWDSVKKELDSVANVAKRSGDNERASVAGNMARTLRGELDQQVPSYANARGAAAQFFGENNALEAGQKLAGKKVDPAQISAVMKQMKPDEQELFREGYASDWANRVISNMSDSRDITKAMFNSPNEKARALAVFGQAGLDKLQTRMTLETIMDGARKAMGNSTTARQLIEAGLAGGTLEGYLSGWDPQKMAAGAAGAAGARKLIGSELAAGARKFVGKVDSKTARLVAELLTSNDPNKLSQGMRMAQKNQRIASGLRDIANRVALAGQQQAAPSASRLYVSPLQGPVPVAAGQEQQSPPGP